MFTVTVSQPGYLPTEIRSFETVEDAANALQEEIRVSAETFQTPKNETPKTSIEDIICEVAHVGYMQILFDNWVHEITYFNTTEIF